MINSKRKRFGFEIFRSITSSKTKKYTYIIKEEKLCHLLHQKKCC